MSGLFPSDEILSAVTYFAITLGADEKGNLWSETPTCWIGFADEDARVEIRKIRPVIPERIARLFEDLRQPFCVVNDDRSFVRWMLGGGHALITEEQTRKHCPGEMVPRPCFCHGLRGFTDARRLAKAAFQKAPTPKLRMEVLKRDRYRCMICGQRPADDVNIQLHVHHIRPFSERGLTIEKNLITLCHTCHTGLDPHHENTLYALTEGERNDSQVPLKRRKLKQHIRDVDNYRNAIKALLQAQPLGATRK